MATPPYPLYHLKRQLIKKCELIKKQFKIEQFNIGKADHSTFKTQHPKFMLLCSPPQYRSALMPPLEWGYNIIVSLLLPRKVYIYALVV